MGFSRQEYWSGVPLPSPWITKLVPLIDFEIEFILFCSSDFCFSLIEIVNNQFIGKGNFFFFFSLDEIVLKITGDI